jgi:hypothetical protein
MLAGVSDDYYTRLEKGNLSGVSDSVLAINTLGQALYSPAFASPARPVNLARFRFFDLAARNFYPDFTDTAHTTVALLRAEAGRDPFDKSLTDLIGELSTRSEEFRTLWAAHNVRLHRSGLKHFHHPVTGRMYLMFEAMALEADEGPRAPARSRLATRSGDVTPPGHDDREGEAGQGVGGEDGEGQPRGDLAEDGRAVVADLAE